MGSSGRHRGLGTGRKKKGRGRQMRKQGDHGRKVACKHKTVCKGGTRNLVTALKLRQIIMVDRRGGLEDE